MNNYLKSKGRLQLKDDTIRLVTSYDFVRYYKSFIDKHFKIFSNTPQHSSHITLWNPKIHGICDKKKWDYLLKNRNHEEIEFEYDIDIQHKFRYGRNFHTFFVIVKSSELTNLCLFLGNEQYKKLHLTIANTKNGFRPYVWFK